MKPLALALSHSLLIGAADAQRTTHGVQITVIDKATGGLIPGAVIVMRLPGGVELKEAATLGWFTWNSGIDPNVMPREREFSVLVAAPGYASASRDFDSGPRTNCTAISVCCYTVAMMSLAAARNAPPPAKEETTPGPVSDWFRYEYSGKKAKDCDGTKLFCTSYVNGVPLGKIDLSGKSSQKRTVSQTFDFNVGPKGKKALGGIGYNFSDEMTAESTFLVDATIGDKQVAANLCGEVCIRLQEDTLTWKIWHDYSDGRSFFHMLVTEDVVTGWCISNDLHDCATKKL